MPTCGQVWCRGRSCFVDPPSSVHRTPSADWAVCVMDTLDDGERVRGGAGFASFYPSTSVNQDFDSEGQRLYSGLDQGRVAFHKGFSGAREANETYHSIISYPTCTHSTSSGGRGGSEKLSQAASLAMLTGRF